MESKNQIAQPIPQPNFALANVAKFYEFQLRKLLKQQELIAGTRGVSITRGARHMSFGITCLPQYMKAIMALDEEIAFISRTKNVTIRRDTGLLMIQYQLRSNLWEEYTGSDVSGFGIGFAENRRQIDFKVTEEASQSFFAGMTGSGKTQAMISAIHSQCRCYTPDEIKIIIIDPANWMSGFNNSAHLAYPIARTETEIDRALAYANQMFLDRKRETIRDDYRLFVIIDETEEVFPTNASGKIINQDRKVFINNILNGRGYKINALVTGLEPKQSKIPFLGKLPHQFVGKTKSHNFPGLKGLEPHKLIGAGDFWHVGQTIEPERFQVAMITEADYKALDRSETPTPTVETTSACDIPLVPDEAPKAGRPKLKIEGNLLVRYLLNNNNYSNTSGPNKLGISLKNHRMHKQVTTEMFDALKKMDLQLKFEKLSGDENE